MTADGRIVAEVYRAIELLGGQSDLLALIGSWGDTMPDGEVLAELRAWNDDKLKELEERVAFLRSVQEQRDANAARGPTE